MSNERSGQGIEPTQHETSMETAVHEVLSETIQEYFESRIVDVEETYNEEEEYFDVTIRSADDNVVRLRKDSDMTMVDLLDNLWERGQSAKMGFEEIKPLKDLPSEQRTPILKAVVTGVMQVYFQDTLKDAAVDPDAYGVIGQSETLERAAQAKAAELGLDSGAMAYVIEAIGKTDLALRKDVSAEIGFNSALPLGQQLDLKRCCRAFVGVPEHVTNSAGQVLRTYPGAAIDNFIVAMTDDIEIDQGTLEAYTGKLRAVVADAPRELTLDTDLANISVKVVPMLDVHLPMKDNYLSQRVDWLRPDKVNAQQIRNANRVDSNHDRSIAITNYGPQGDVHDPREPYVAFERLQDDEAKIYLQQLPMEAALQDVKLAHESPAVRKAVTGALTKTLDKRRGMGGQIVQRLQEQLATPGGGMRFNVVLDDEPAK